ncbi:unnamed protein product [Musa hybrid cultivar]
MDPGGRGGRAEAERWLAVAERLLGVRDLLGTKRFAERAMEVDPLLDGVDQILAVADVLLASQRRVNNHVDWYAVLQLPPPSPSPSSSSSTDAGDAAAVKRQYRRLALLLHPDRNRAPGADAAFRLVVDAFAVLSDPTKKSLFDAELHIANSAAAAAAASSSKPFPISSSSAAADPFWTACLSCCHVHQYAREYLNLTLRCPNCRRPFQATKLAAAPPVVPGTNMYYCSWGFFPLGFPGGPSFYAGNCSFPDLNSEWKPFFPMFPNSEKIDPSQNSKHGQEDVTPPREPQNTVNTGNVVEPQSTGPVTRSKKKMAMKKVVGGPKKSPLGGGNRRKRNGDQNLPTVDPEQWAGSEVMPTNTGGVEGRGININQEFKGGSESGVQGNDDYTMNFHIDVNATDEILDNLQNLPFLRDEEIPLRVPYHSDDTYKSSRLK